MVKELNIVKELRGKILGMEMELNILSRDLERLNAEYSYNIKLQKKINENIAFLKRDHVVVSLKEYKVIKQQKRLIDMRVKLYSKKVNPLKKIVKSKESKIKTEMDVFERVYRLQFKTNILEFPCQTLKETK